MGIFLNIFTVDLWEKFFFDFLNPIKQAPALKIYQGTDMRVFTHSVKKTTGLPGIGIRKHGNYDLTIRWMYVLSDTPTIIQAQSNRHTLAVARIPSCLGYMGETERACAMPRHKQFFGASESSTCEASREKKMKLCYLPMWVVEIQVLNCNTKIIAFYISRCIWKKH